MVDAAVQDFATLDRDVARGWSALGRWRQGLAENPEARAGEEPLEPVRYVTGKSTWDALAALDVGEAQRAHRDGLSRWVYALLQARIGREAEVEEARAASEPSGRYEGETPRRVSWREAWRGVVAARTTGDARKWLDAAADAAPPLAVIAARRAQLRVEAARRLGHAHPWDPLAPAPRAALLSAAARLLDATEELARDVRRRRFPADARPADVVHGSVARDTAEGWPTRLAPRWLHELFGDGTRGLRVELGALPQVLGASSFARALYAFGDAFARAAAPATPFALGHEPWDVRAHRAGYLFAGLAADAEFHARALHVGRRGALAQARELAGVALLDARLCATRLLLGDDAAPARADRFDDLGARLYGASLDARLRGAWPRAREDEPARFAALARASLASDSLRERFDVDWFRNPRAWEALRAAHAGPARETLDADALDAGVAALSRAFEEALA